MTYQVALTATGAAKLAAGIVNLTHMALGDGGGSEYDPTGAETALVNEVYRQPLSAYNVTDNKVMMQLSIPITDGGFSIREAGVFDTDGDMIYIANLATRYKPLPTEGSASDLSITLVTTVSNIANLTVTVDGTAYITQTVLTAELANKIDKVDDKATAAEAEAATDTDKFMTPETTYAAYGASDPVVLTTSPHNQLITESILTGSAAPMVINLADVATYPKSKLNRIALTIANLSNKNWTITPAAGSGALSETLSITGSTTTPPTYALDATSLPTVTNGTIASNLFTATANNASAQTFDYVSSGDISSITPQMKFVPGTVLTVDPASTTGNIKFNYTTNALVQVGTKLLVDIAGTISEITVTSGNQAGGITFDSNWGILKIFEVNNYLFLSGLTNKHIAKSTNGVLWTDMGVAPITPNSLVFFNGLYYLGGSGSSVGTAQIYSSPNLTNWTLAHAVTLGRVITSFVATDGTKLVIAYSGSAGDTDAGNNAYYIYSSADGIAYTQRVNQTTGTGVVSGVAETRSLFYANGKFIYANFANSIAYSNEGTSWTNLNNPRYANGYVGGAWYSGSLFCISSFTGATNTGTISTSPDFSVWTDKITGLTDPTDNFVQNGSTIIALANTPLTAFYSTDSGATWSTGVAMVSRAVSGIYSTILSKYIAQVTTSNGHIQTTTSPTTAWTDANMTTSTNYQFTMTSPAIVKPDWVALSNQSMQYSVSATSTPALTTATSPTYTRSGNVITATYAQVTGLSGTHVQLKALTLNSGDVLSQISATLTSGTLQTINGKPSYSLAPGKVALFIPTQSGWLSANTGAISVRKVTANYTMTSNDDVVIIGANNLVITVPDATAVEQGRVYRIKAGDFTGGSIATQSSQTIDGTTPPTLNTLENLTIYSDGANWLID